MATVTVRGKAVVEGISGAFTLIVYPMQQKGELTANYDEEIIRDFHGFACAWLARDTHYLANFGFKLVGDTHAHAVSGGAIIEPLHDITLSDFDLPGFNGQYQNVSGQKLSLGNMTVADMDINLRRYADPTQAALSVTTPA